MKQFKNVAIAIVLLVAATSFVHAQSKIAHINVTELLGEMPEMKAAQAELKKLQETYRADIESSMTELRNFRVLKRTLETHNKLRNKN